MDYPGYGQEVGSSRRTQQLAGAGSKRRSNHAHAQGSRDQYWGLARIYDRVVGDVLFPDVWDSFQRSLQAFRIRFSFAADLGFGTGLFLHHLARQYRPERLYGIDRSPAMLRVAAARNHGGGVRLMRGHIASFRLPQHVDLITCNGDTLNYLLSARQLLLALSCCRDNLTHDGHLLFDLITGGQKRGPSNTVIQDIRLPDATSRWTVTVDPRRKCSIVIMRSLFRTVSGTLRRETEVHAQRWYPISVIRDLLRRANLALRGTLDMETHRPADEASVWVKFVARKS